MGFRYVVDKHLYAEVQSTDWQEGQSIYHSGKGSEIIPQLRTAILDKLAQP